MSVTHPSDTTQEPRTIGSAAPAAVLALTAVIGALSGVLAKAADESTLTWASDLGTYPALWVVVLAVLGVTAPSLHAAALRSATVFVTMCLGYYGWSMFALGFGSTSLLVAWLAVAVTAVPVAAVAAWWARRNPGVVSAAVAAAAVVLVASDGLLHRTAAVVTGVPVGGPGHWPQVVADLLAIGALLTVVPGDRRSRLLAAALAVPAAWLGPRIVEALVALV